MGKVLIYGITGYTGQLMAKEVSNRGWRHVVVAGRDANKTQFVANRYNLEYLSFSLLDGDEIRHHLQGFKAILNCAGPFSETIHPLVDICIEMGVHYLDVTGETDVFLKLMKLNHRAEKSGCMLLPGVGFDVVPSDCLARYAQSLLPEATHLDIAIKGLGSASRGTLNTALKHLYHPTLIRRDSKIIDEKKPLRKMIRYDEHEESSLAVSWGDVVTAYHSTKIPNITVYFKESLLLEKVTKMPYMLKWFLSLSWVRKVIYRSQSSKPGPSQDELRSGSTTLLATVWNEKQSKRVKITIPNGYVVTVSTSLHCLDKVFRGQVKAGFQTPSTAFNDLLNELDYQIDLV